MLCILFSDEHTHKHIHRDKDCKTNVQRQLIIYVPFTARLPFGQHCCWLNQ